MSKRAHKRAVVGRDQRRAAFDAAPLHVKKGTKRPGSLNPKRSARARGRKK